MTYDEASIRDLPPGTLVRDPDTGEELSLDRHTDLDDGWWLSDGSWLRWHHVEQYLVAALVHKVNTAIVEQAIADLPHRWTSDNTGHDTQGG